MEYIAYNSVKIPSLGFGTFQLQGRACSDAVTDAIAVGYRHIDTAVIYHNESETGTGIRNSGISRDELFLTTKLWTDSLDPYSVAETAERSLRRLQTDYLDLLLIHWPSNSVPLADTLGAMNRLREEGKVRFLGVSNFTVAWLEKVEETGVPVITNQVEYHVLLSQEKLLSYMRNKGIFLTAYSPLAKGMLVRQPVLEEIGKKYGKSSSQVALRWLIEHGDVAAIPKASDREKRRLNFDIFDFQLDAEDHEKIGNMEKNKRFVDFPGLSPEWD